MCNLFRAYLYFEKNILKQNRWKGRGKKETEKRSEVADIPLLIRKYCIIKKKRQESNWPLSRLCSCISGVFCNTPDTDLWRNIMHN